MLGHNTKHKKHKKISFLKEREKSVLSHPVFAKSKGIPLSTWRDIFEAKDKLMKPKPTVYMWVVEKNSQGALVISH